MKTISVLLAAYNGAQWLPEQLDSLAAQTDGGFRVLMQDDGSSDDTALVLKQRCGSDDRFKLAGHQGEHFGAVGNFFSLMAQDDADYSALCDQDDRWLPERLARCRAAMEEAEQRLGHDTPILVHSDCRVMAADGTVLHDSFFRHQGWDPKAVTLNRLLVQNNATGCTMLMNRALRTLALACVQPNKLVMHDWFLACTAAAFGQVIFLDEPLVCYRQHGHNVMGASADDLGKRGVAALSRREKGRKRIALTYQHAHMLRESWGAALPERSVLLMERYLKLENRSKPVRLAGYLIGGYTMQSPVTLAGQLFFG